ncbi:MAG: hypothetical protein Q4D23_03240 [Bacteroidales bacterium]|nr:hypothetical protein [Bacteroidales bacterium]
MNESYSIPTRNSRIQNPAVLREVSTARTVSSLLVVLMVAYTLFAMVQGLMSFSMNRIFGGLIALLLAYDFAMHLTRWRIFTACVISIIAVIGIGVFTTNVSDEVEFWIYFLCTLLMLSYLSRPGSLNSMVDACGRYRKLLVASIVVATALLAVLLLTRTGYVTSWGGGTYFEGLANTEHTMASISCILMAISLLSYKNGSFGKFGIFIVCTIASYAILQTGARTFLVPALLIWILVVNETIQRRWIRIAVVVVLAAAMAAMFATSGMANKFDYVGTVGGSGGADVFTSGRFGYWLTDLGAFFSGDAIHQLVGNSASFIYDLNQRMFMMRIWSHDDFIMVLCSTGYLGLCIYIVVLQGFFKSLSNAVHSWRFWLLFAYLMFPALFNGFYGYQHFVYSTVFIVCAMVARGDYLARK